MAISDKLTQIANNVPLVYDAGYDEGYEKGIAEGGDSYYDTFWDNYQNNGESGVAGTYGKRTTFDRAFSGYGWYDANFSPKYNMKPLRCSMMFQTSQITNLEKLLQEQGRVIDTSESTNFQQAFQDCKITHLPKIDAKNATTLSYTFASSNLVSIKELVVSETVPFSNTFNGATNLSHMIVTGTIGQNGFDVSMATKLDKDSIESIINALSATTTGLSVTLSLTAVNREFETSAGANDGSTSAEWISLTAPKTDTTQQYYWVISLI